MPSDLTSVMHELEGFIRKEFLDGDPSAELSMSTPLLDWGILNSMNTARLTAFIRDRFGAVVPPSAVTAATFRDIASISSMVIKRADLSDAVE
jgi:acyl carrier protein